MTKSKTRPSATTAKRDMPQPNVDMTKGQYQRKRTRMSFLSRTIDVNGLMRKDLAAAMHRDGSWLSKVTAGTIGVSVEDAVTLVEVINRMCGGEYSVGDFWNSEGLVNG